ncbi:MAG: heme lyase CcmF/NrfE family subunit [Gammaproteobacteria bacterium]|nr:heme lyase CcmF/NrfE family subunit [Gammaproteobacteria bacterium]
MISQLGFVALLLALGLAVSCQFLSYDWGLKTSRCSAIFILIAYVALSLAFLMNEFTIAYVLKNSSVMLPWYYRLCAVWGGHEGSVLLWLGILALLYLLLSIQMLSLPIDFAHKMLRVAMIMFTGFLLFIIVSSNPFSLQFQELNPMGRDLNPLLQDPGFLLHPPMLYLGYVGFGIPYIFAMAALWQGEFKYLSLRMMRPWVIFAWSCLSLGITLGSWWAYRELGWGGFWFWDPVENASLMPWLVGTALLHAVMTSERQQVFVAWTIFLAVTAFALSLVGTFLVRSGVLTSVHAFAVDPKRGLFILIFLTSMLLWAYVLYILKASTLFVKKHVALVSRESGLLLNNIFLLMMMAVVLLGTIYPLIIDGLGLGKLSVGAPYFNAALLPILILLMLCMGLGVLLKWQDTRKLKQLSIYLLPIILGFVLSAILLHVLYGQVLFKAWLCLGLSLWIMLSLLLSLKKRCSLSGFPKSLRYWSMFLAHLGFSLSIIGVVISTHYGQELDLKMKPNESIILNHTQVIMGDETEIKGPNYHGSRVDFIIKQGEQLAHIYPEKRIYDIGKMVMTDADILMTFGKDIYISLGEPIGQEAWALRIYTKPLIRWIWLGGVLMFIAGMLALLAYRQDSLR